MDNGLDPQFPGHGNGEITAVIVYQKNIIHDIPRDFIVGLAQGFFSVVGRQDNYDFLPSNIISLPENDFATSPNRSPGPRKQEASKLAPGGGRSPWPDCR